jgi:hypothetical protein
MPILFTHGFHRLGNFLSGQKVTKEPPTPMVSVFLLFIQGF